MKMFENKKVLLVGLGILGGGTSMAKFILDQGGELSITDLRNRDLLVGEIEKIEKYVTKKGFRKVNFFLEKHEEEMFRGSDVVVFNPAVPYFSKWPQYCLENKIPFYNDFTLFQEYLFLKGNNTKQIWITGTRGKTTTTTFIHHLLGDGAIVGGNVLGSGLQKISNKKGEFFVLETSNYQLEYPIFNKEIKKPEAAVITNILIDHINRHKTVEEYRRVKKLIFSYNPGATLFLNKKEKSIEDIWKNKEHKNIRFISATDNREISLLFAISVAKLFNVSEKDIQKRIKTLKSPPMRQEVVLENKKWRIVNDSCATSPDALIAAVKTFKDAYFISGGTDAELDFSDLVKVLPKVKVKFLQGTATDKILGLLNKTGQVTVYDDLEKVVKDWKNELGEMYKKDKKQKTIILSPGAKSFGMFKNEYDRGERFNKIIKKLFK
jgi:UDP-N-acetylmuramoylalanine--D-glutamate ligase